MVKLVRNRDNRVPVKVTSYLDYDGFSASLEVEGLTKTVTNLKTANAKIEFTADEVDALGDFVLGHLTVYDKNGDEFIKMLVQIKVVDTEGDAVGFQAFRMALVSVKAYTYSGGSVNDPDIVRRSDFEGLEKAKPSINSCQDTINSIVDTIVGE